MLVRIDAKAPALLLVDMPGFHDQRREQSRTKSLPWSGRLNQSPCEIQLSVLPLSKEPNSCLLGAHSQGPKSNSVKEYKCK